MSHLLDETATERQTIETLELLAFLDENQELSGLATVEIRVLNGWKLDALNTFGRPHSDFACLRDCVKERLVQAGYDMRNFDYGQYFKD